MEDKDRLPVAIRDMEPGEERALVWMARRIFSPLEQMGISKPKTALVAEVDGNIAGAAFLRIYGKGEKKIGYVELAFVNSQYRGKGVGNALYPTATQRLRAMGCDTVTAMVKDDNAASWKLFAKQGFHIPTLTGLGRELGFGRAAMLWLRTIFCIACGMNFWIDRECKEQRSLPELFAFLWVNFALFLPGLYRVLAEPAKLVTYALAYPFTLLAGVLAGGIGCLIAGGKWRFQMTRGGALITLLIQTLGGVFPMAGRWYPESAEATPACRRKLGVQAAVEWIGVAALYALGLFLLKDNAFFYRCAAYSTNLLLFRLIPTLPFGHFGGERVWNLSKIAFAVLAVATAALLFIP